MRWTGSPKPKHLNIRIVKRFLLFPCRIKDDCRWLEIVRIRQQFFVCSNWPYSRGWVDVAWVDKEEEI